MLHRDWNWFSPSLCFVGSHLRTQNENFLVKIAERLLLLLKLLRHRCWRPRLSLCVKDVNQWVQVQNLSYTPGLWNYINLLSSKSPQIRASDGLTNPGWRMINQNPCSTLIMAAIWMLFLRHIRTCIRLGGRRPIGFSLDPPYMSTQQSSCGELCHRIGFKPTQPNNLPFLREVRILRKSRGEKCIHFLYLSKSKDTCVKKKKKRQIQLLYSSKSTWVQVLKCT